MSGIMGIYHLDGRPVDREDLGLMIEVLAHRGLDGADIWVDGFIGFGHRMLWTTPESLLEKLPLVNQTGDIIITSDARIDNRNELISRLDVNNCPPEKITDSQLILAAYEKWGEQCPEHLLGDFAFAIWDRRKQIFFCARDHMGVKPLYYYHQPGIFFAFASEIKALLCLKQIPRRLNEVKVGDYLASIFSDKSSTLYQDIFRLPPANCMTLSVKEMQIRSYWSLDNSRELRLGSDEEYAEALCKIFAEAVRCRLRSAFPVGSHLSGGIDSSSITCMARLLMQEENRSLHTFSNIFDAVPECDERPFIEAVTVEGNLIPHYVPGDQIGPLSDLEHIFKYHDEAISGPTHFFVWKLNQATQREGVRIILDGFDGDNTLSHGAGYFIELISKGQWSSLVEEVNEIHKLTGASQRSIIRYNSIEYLENLARHWQWIAFFRTTHQLSKYFNISGRSLFLHHGFKPLLPQFLRRAWRALRGHSQAQKDDNWIINRHFFRRIGLKKRIQNLDNSSNLLLTERENHWRNITSGILPQGLEILDHYAAAFSLEARHPFMDKRLIEFCVSLPPEQKFHQGWSRYVMRRAMENILPKEVQWRHGKSDLSSSFTYGLLKYDQRLLDEVMKNHLKSISNYVDTDIISKAYEEFISTSNTQFPQGSTDILLWKVGMFALWREQAQIK